MWWFNRETRGKYPRPTPCCVALTQAVSSNPQQHSQLSAAPPVCTPNIRTWKASAASPVREGMVGRNKQLRFEGPEASGRGGEGSRAVQRRAGRLCSVLLKIHLSSVLHTATSRALGSWKCRAAGDGDWLCATPRAMSPRRRDVGTNGADAPGCPFPCRCPCVLSLLRVHPKLCHPHLKARGIHPPPHVEFFQLINASSYPREREMGNKTCPQKYPKATSPRGNGLLGLNCHPAQVSHRWGRSTQQTDVLKGQGRDSRGCSPRAEPILGISTWPAVGPWAQKPSAQKALGRAHGRSISHPQELFWLPYPHGHQPEHRGCPRWVPKRC
ncbi:uncharacterized protein LOC116237446 [Phasianus colchicus]|uniref:uncharacterized protein LOC116237446 n=1 Tax=Phasianus colchicus TaxID=9054 RepID=UPI00129E3898|nr:uncharacterized protein LOC116237446 [Phasianus colchicus]